MTWLHVVIDVPRSTMADEAAFWSGALGWELGPEWEGHPELRSFVPPVGDCYVHLQVVADLPRVHLDLEAADPADVVRRARAAGAEPVADRRDRTTLRSPGGLAFCVLAARDHRPPPPTTWPTGHRSRLVQLCIDSPRSRREAELTFWRSLLPGRWVPSDSPEFDAKWHDDEGGPVQLLFQGLGEEDGLVRAHMDHGTDDRAAEVTRLLALGATDVGPGDSGWHTLSDPAGLAFCVTDNAPDTTTRRDIG